MPVPFANTTFVVTQSFCARILSTSDLQDIQKSETLNFTSIKPKFSEKLYHLLLHT